MIPSLTHSPDISLLHFSVHGLAKLVSLPFIRKVQTYREFLCVYVREVLVSIEWLMKAYGISHVSSYRLHL